MYAMIDEWVRGYIEGIFWNGIDNIFIDFSIYKLVYTELSASKLDKFFLKHKSIT